MKRYRTAMFTLTCVAGLLTGCATYPMGLTEQQWEALSPEKQAEYRAKQYEIDAQERRHAREMRLKEEQIAAERAEAERLRIASLYESARYRDIVNVTLGAAILTDGRNRYRSEPVSFDLIRGELKAVEVRGIRGHSWYAVELTARLDETGNMVYLNEQDGGRDRTVLAYDDWERGARYAVDSMAIGRGAELSGVIVRIKYKSTAHEPRRLFIEDR